MLCRRILFCCSSCARLATWDAVANGVNMMASVELESFFRAALSWISASVVGVHSGIEVSAIVIVPAAIVTRVRRIENEYTSLCIIVLVIIVSNST